MESEKITKSILEQRLEGQAERRFHAAMQELEQAIRKSPMSGLILNAVGMEKTFRLKEIDDNYDLRKTEIYMKCKADYVEDQKRALTDTLLTKMQDLSYLLNQ